LHTERAALEHGHDGVLANRPKFLQSDSRCSHAVLVVRHEVFPDQYAIRSDQIVHRMRNTVSSKPRSYVGVEDPEAADHSAIVVGEQWKTDAMLVRKALEYLRGIVTDGRDPDTMFLQRQTGLFQLDQLGTAVGSPVRAAMKHQQQAVWSSKIRERTQNSVLTRKSKLRDMLAGLGPRSVAIVSRVHELGIQFFGHRLPGRSPPSKLAHDRSLFFEIFRKIVSHRMSSQSIINGSNTRLKAKSGEFDTQKA